MSVNERQPHPATTPSDFRTEIRQGRWPGPTGGCCPGFTQTNIVILPQKHAFDFLLFCQRNPKPCPVLEVMEAGNYEPVRLAPGADIRTDCPRYRVFRNGVPEEMDNIGELWRDDLVTFLLGCSFTFEQALLTAGLPVRHIEENKIVPMFITSKACDSAGRFHGPMVVTMRPIPADMVSKAVQVTARFPGVHGAPVHVGHPEAIGIRDLMQPDFGEAVTIGDGEIPVFWACGITPQMAIAAAHIELVITHAPGHMFILDRRDVDFAAY